MKTTTTENDGRTGLRCYLGHSGGDAPARKRHRGRAPGGTGQRTRSVDTGANGIVVTDACVRRAGPHPFLDRRAAR